MDQQRVKTLYFEPKLRKVATADCFSQPAGAPFPPGPRPCCVTETWDTFGLGRLIDSCTTLGLDPGAEIRRHATHHTANLEAAVKQPSRLSTSTR